MCDHDNEGVEAVAEEDVVLGEAFDEVFEVGYAAGHADALRAAFQAVYELGYDNGAADEAEAAEDEGEDDEVEGE